MAWEKKPFYSVTEFSYAFAFLHEQTLDFHDDLIVAPITPNLIQEGKLAWDAFLTLKAGLFFFQFKNPEYIVRPDARCVRRRDDREEFPTPCYRITLHKKGNYSQHILLKRWAKRFPWTFYVAPQIADDNTYQRFFFTNQITDNSRFIQLRSCRNYSEKDPEPHYIVYGNEDAQIRHCSENVSEIRGSFVGKKIRRLYEGEEHWEDIDIPFLLDLYDRCCKLADRNEDLKKIKKRIVHLEKRISPKEKQQIMVELLTKSSEILSYKLGLSLVLVSEKKHFTITKGA